MSDAAHPHAALDLRAVDCLVAEKVFGIDLRASSPADIGDAVMTGMSSNIPKTSYSVMSFDWGAADDFELTYQGSKFGYGGADGNDGYGLWFWEQREGKDWQPFIEAHVAKWRRPVKSYTTSWDAAGQVLEKWSCELAHAQTLQWHCHLTRWDKTTGGWLSGKADADTAPLAICLAALAAFGVDVEAAISATTAASAPNPSSETPGTEHAP